MKAPWTHFVTEGPNRQHAFTVETCDCGRQVEGSNSVGFHETVDRLVKLGLVQVEKRLPELEMTEDGRFYCCGCGHPDDRHLGKLDCGCRWTKDGIQFCAKHDATGDLIDVLERLVAWADRMGGWDSKVFADAQALLKRVGGAR